MIETLSEGAVLNFFIGGFHASLKGPARLLRPTTLHNAYTLAKLHNELIVTQQNAKLNSGRKTHYEGAIRQTPASTNHFWSSNKSSPVKTMSNKEMENRRAKGICYWCP